MRTASTLLSCLIVLGLPPGSPFWASLPVLRAEDKPSATPKASAAGGASYHRDIRPILRRKCQGCHQPAKKDGKLVVTTYEALKEGGRHGPGFEPGKPEESWLLRYLTGERKPRMPKGQPPLAETEIESVRAWIRDGAVDDTPASARVAPSAPAAYPLPPAITALQYSPDGTLLAVGGCHEILLHVFSPLGPPEGTAGTAASEPVSSEAVPGQGGREGVTGGSTPRMRLPGLSQRIESLVFSPDGSLLAAAGGSPGDVGEVQLWAMPEGKLLRSLAVSYDSLFGASFSPDGKVLALGCADNSARLIQVEDGRQLLRIDHHADWVFGAMFSMDQKHLITVSRDRAMKLTEVSSGSFIDNVTSITPGVLGGGLQCLARHPREDKFATGGEDGVPRLYKIVRTAARQIGDDNNLLRAFEKMPGVITAVAFSPDGERLLVGATSGEARVYALTDGARLATLAAGPSPVFCVAYRSDGKSAAIGGKDGQVRIFAVPEGKLQRSFVAVPLTIAPAEGAIAPAEGAPAGGPRADGVASAGAAAAPAGGGGEKPAPPPRGTETKRTRKL